MDDIIADCAKGKIWGTIDMTDSFFQTRIHPDDIHKTAVSTPLGAYEWTVMPMGFRNSPATQQRCVTNVLSAHIGKICHVYMDDIVIWSQTLEEHEANVHTIMDALKEARLYVNKSFLPTRYRSSVTLYLKVEADRAKVSRILEWPQPRNVKQV